jgi:PAS domain S-box-containing protein
VESREPIRILLIDDDEDACLVTRDLLASTYGQRLPLDYSVSYADGLERLVAGRYDVCLLDYELGGRTGVELLEAARARGVTTPVIILTGHAQRDLDLRAMSAGAVDYLLKGNLDPHELERAVRYARERARSAEATRRAAATFRALIDGLPDAVLVHRDGTVVYANRAAALLFGVEHAQLLHGRSPGELIDARDRGRAEELHKLVPAEGRTALTELRASRDGADAVLVEAFALRVEFDGEPATLTSYRDLTERKLMEQRLHLAYRMASVGTLAAGVAHEVNNPLAFLIANLATSAERIDDLLRAWRQEGPPVARDELRTLLGVLTEPLDQARQGGERVRTIVASLKSLSRPDEERVGPVDVRAVIDSALAMAANEIRHRAKLERVVPELPPVVGNEARLGQLVLNLLINAAQALPEGAADQHTIRVSGASEGGRVIIEVSDTGPGIPAAIQSRIFEPFFTTKPIGVGTGLGLSICHAIATSFGGAITVESAEGRGATFRVSLPAALQLTLRQSQLPPPESGRSAAVLVIDDEPMIGVAVKRALGRVHQVTCVTSSRAALDQIEAGKPFDVVLCDLMMPTMTGIDFYNELERVAPAMRERVIFMTGGAFTPTSRAFLDRSPNPRLDKPFDVRVLRALIDQQLKK